MVGEVSGVVDYQKAELFLEIFSSEIGGRFETREPKSSARYVTGMEIFDARLARELALPKVGTAYLGSQTSTPRSFGGEGPKVRGRPDVLV